MPMYAYYVLVISILIQFIAAFLALRLVWITKKTIAWTLIASGIFLMALRRCFTLYEWFTRNLDLLPVDISTEFIGLATSLCMLGGVALIMPLFIDLKRSKEELRQKVEERTAQIKSAYQALQLELSERQQAEEALRRSEERFRTVADFTYNWESWLAPDGSFTYMSPSVERITGYRPEEFYQDPSLLEKVIHPDDRAFMACHIQEELGVGEARSIEFRIITKNGEERWIGHICQPVYSPEGKNLGRRSSNRDISGRKRSESETMKLESQLRQAHKMEAIGTLAGGIAHDFNNILSPIMMYTEIALRSAADDNMRLYLEQVLKSSRRASDLVKQILAISRQTEQQRIIMQLSPIIKESLKLLRASFPSTIEIRQHLAPEGDWLVADPTEIYQVVMNLFTNAAHALKENSGVIDVNLDVVEIHQEQSALGLTLQPGSYVRLSLQDSGQGMTPEVMERIFEPYFTTKETGEGTGLGLALVHSIVKAYRGGINVSSEPGKGTLFQVLLPKAGSSETLEAKEAGPLPTGQERILMVDDEADIVEATKIILEQAGYRVSPFTDSRAALAAFRDAPDSFDLVITDLTMPGVTGVELTQALLEISPRLPILLCTGYGGALTGDKARALGIREVMLKPIIPQELTARIRQILDTPTA
jgi:PAS domain S-box-containing protein